MPGYTQEISGGHCFNNVSTGLPDDDCIFVVTGPENLRSSVMAVPYLAGNDQWCDQTEAREHDDEIPTKQNALCDGQSVMEVVLKHEDFTGFQPIVNLTGEVTTTPTFKLIRPSPSRNAKSLAESEETVILQDTFSNTPSVSSSVTIDQFTGSNVTVQLDFQLHGEANVTMDFANFSSEKISGTGVVTFPFVRVEPGNYSVNITTDGASIQFLTLQIRSKAPPQTVPLTTSCWTNVGQTEVNLQGPSPDRLVLYGKVFQGVSPVIKADITGVITSEDNTKVEVSMKDDGIPPDNIKNDGIYSAYFTDFKPNQRQSRHSFSIKVTGTEDTGLVAGAARGKSFPSVPTSSTPLCCGSTAVKDDTPLDPTGIFTRSASGGVITFGETGADTNIFPPGPIRDLSVGHFAEDHFLLSFTSPGADLNTGTIDQFIIFYSNNKTLLNNLTVSSDIPRVNGSDLACSNCTLDPLPPADKVQLSLNLDSFTRGEKIFFRVVAADEEGKTSQSNMANILLSDRVILGMS